MLSDRTEHKEVATVPRGENRGFREASFRYELMCFWLQVQCQCINSMMQPERRENVPTVREASPEMVQGTSTGPDEAMKRRRG